MNGLTTEGRSTLEVLTARLLQKLEKKNTQKKPQTKQYKMEDLSSVHLCTYVVLNKPWTQRSAETPFKIISIFFHPTWYLSMAISWNH